MNADTIAGLFISLFFIAAGVFSLRFMFNPSFRSSFLKNNERRRLRILPLKKSEVQQRRELGEGMLLAWSVIVTLIFLPIGLIMFIGCIWQIVQSIFR